MRRVGFSRMTARDAPDGLPIGCAFGNFDSSRSIGSFGKDSIAQAWCDFRYIREVCSGRCRFDVLQVEENVGGPLVPGEPGPKERMTPGEDRLGGCQLNGKGAESPGHLQGISGLLVQHLLVSGRSDEPVQLPAQLTPGNETWLRATSGDVFNGLEQAMVNLADESQDQSGVFARVVERRRRACAKQNGRQVRDNTMGGEILTEHRISPLGGSSHSQLLFRDPSQFGDGGFKIGSLDLVSGHRVTKLLGGEKASGQ